MAGGVSLSGLKEGGRQTAVAALDLGASKIACFIMTADGVRRADHTIRVAGAGYVQSRGVRGGGIIDMDAAAQAVAQAVDRAERAAGVGVSGVVVTSAGGQMSSRRVRAEISLGTRPVGDAELARCIAAALAQSHQPNRRPIHLLPIAWSVDGQIPVRDPRNMCGRVLSLEMLIVSMAEPAFANLSHCLELAHLDFQGVAAAPYVSGLAALEPDELDLGCACIDMGGGSTSTAVFGGGSLLHLDSLPVGGEHVTADVARGLSTSKAGAERLKTLHGSAIASSNEDREMVEAPPRGDDPGAGPVVVARGILKNVIAPRVEETLELVRDRLKASGAPLDPGAGIVLTGGASQLAGVRELAVRVFDRPVRLGRPKRAPHLADAAAGPAFCAAAGVLLRAAYGPREAVSTRKLMSARLTPKDAPQVQRGPLLARAAGWLRENL
ncbi:cell division protein FtsA [Brevundimonas sp. 2R-24]|uniref:Cell division protein FtsA n=1 Tax=Peiella sedimenti TaxID=3061083 RepID=A0ABT8SMG9_9CAUL|nr:cell division protein FtsA [Caulobacteraceae bacterium XZ-24]